MNKKKLQIWLLRILPFLLIFLQSAVTGSGGSDAIVEPDWEG